MQGSTLIYALYHPVSGEIRYIGKTKNGLYFRRRQHICSAEKGKSYPVCQWIRKLLAAGLEPSITLIEEVASGLDWRDREKWWIATYRAHGIAKLLNIAEGGCGEARPRSEGEILRQRQQSAAHARSFIRKTNEGRVFDATVRLNMSLAHRGKTGRKWSGEQRRNYLKNRKYEPWSEERRAKTMLARRQANYAATPEHRKALSEQMKRVWAERRAAKQR